VSAAFGTAPVLLRPGTARGAAIGRKDRQARLRIKIFSTNIPATPMDKDEREDLVRRYLAYLEHVRLPSTAPATRVEYERLAGERSGLRVDEAHFQAWNDLQSCISHDPELAWSMLLELIARCDPSDLTMLGAGPLESFLYWQAIPFVDRFEAELRTNPRFFDAFRSLHMGGIPERIWRRLNEVLAELGVPRDQLAEWWTDEELYPQS
jgi:hypothetical protein